jgi:hypothetical protein
MGLGRNYADIHAQTASHIRRYLGEDLVWTSDPTPWDGAEEVYNCFGLTVMVRGKGMGCDVRTRRGTASEFYELAPPRIRCAVANSSVTAPRIRGGAAVASDLRSAPA